MTSLTVLTTLDVVGTVAFISAGYSEALKNRLDLLGVIFVSFLTAFGGGVVRDMMLNSPITIFNTFYLTFTGSVTVLILVFIRKIPKKMYILADTVGLAVFAYFGALAALSAGLNLAGVLFIALLTSTGGGLIRDIALNVKPHLFTADFYGTIAVFIAAEMYIIHIFLGYSTLLSLSLPVIISGIILRFIAIHYKWSLPTI